MRVRDFARAGLSAFVLSFYFAAAYAVDYTGDNSEDPFLYEEANKNDAKLGVRGQGKPLVL